MRRLCRWWLCVVPLLLLAILALVGCGSGGSSSEALAMMKKVPKDSIDLTFMDLKALRGDPDLAGLYNSAAEQLNRSGAGIPTDNVERMAQAGYLTVMEGRFDLASLEAELEASAYGESDYRGISLWEGSFSSVALVSASCLVTAWDVEAVKSCVDVIQGQGESLYDDAEFKDLMGRMPGGFTQMVFAGGEDFGDTYQGVQAIGYSLAKMSSEKARMTLVLAFSDATRAGEAVDGVKEMLSSQGGDGGLGDLEVIRDGRYVKATGQIPIEGALG